MTTSNDYSQVPLEIIRQITVTSTSNDTVDGRFGPERSFIATVPWTDYPYNVKYPVALGIDPHKGEQIWCRFARENRRKNQAGEFHPGTNEYHFWWGLKAYNIEAPEPGQENVMGTIPKDQSTNGTTTYSPNQLFGTPSSSTSSWAKSKDEQIAWNSAINNANSVMVTRTNREGKLLEYDDYYEGELAYMSHKFYLLIRNGPDFDKYGSLLDIEEPTVTEAPEQPVVEQASVEQPVVEQAVQATLEPATSDGMPG